MRTISRRRVLRAVKRNRAHELDGVIRPVLAACGLHVPAGLDKHAALAWATEHGLSGDARAALDHADYVNALGGSRDKVWFAALEAPSGRLAA
jgi:hypothetical protein